MQPARAKPHLRVIEDALDEVLLLLGDLADIVALLLQVLQYKQMDVTLHQGKKAITSTWQLAVF